MKLYKVVCACVSLTLALGCAIGPKMQTPSGRPEVLIPGADRAAVIAALTERMLAKDYPTVSATDYTVVFRKEHSWGELTGKKASRITYNLLKADTGVRVIALLQWLIIDEWRDKSKSGVWAQEIQELLESVRASLASKS